MKKSTSENFYMVAIVIGVLLLNAVGIAVYYLFW